MSDLEITPDGLLGRFLVAWGDNVTNPNPEVEEPRPVWTGDVFSVDPEDEPIHHVGDPDCDEGWCGDYYPRPCQCGGLIHAEFGDEYFDEEGDEIGYWLWRKCDRCGNDYRE